MLINQEEVTRGSNGQKILNLQTFLSREMDMCIYSERKTKSCFKFSKDNETLLPFQIYSLYDTSMQNAIVNKILLMSDTVGIAIHSSVECTRLRPH